ncbi:MAG: tryptophan--tRNA ligase [Clostridia bacterium]|nr:tryptophan--tRNA ligase [Clostridia bacterium]
MFGDLKTVLSGVQPSGNLTIGNYLGAIKNFSAFAGEYKPFYCVVDLHAITVRQVPAELRRRTYETLALYIASGLDPEKNVLFVQSHVPAHAELGWILDCYTMFGELSRMTQFKDKSAKHADNINAGLFTYPTLMAADILLYQADLVPIGADQKQHLELTRNIAERFNQVYGETFTVPEPYIPKSGMKIMSLQEPTLKMSKSDPNPNAVVRILDPRDEILRKFKRAVTDSGAEVRFSEEKPGVSNLMTIYSCFSGKSFAEIEAEFAGKGYGDFKAAVGEVTADALAPVQAEFNRLMGDKAYLEGVMKSGAEQASYYAHKTLSKVRRKIGFVN